MAKRNCARLIKRRKRANGWDVLYRLDTEVLVVQPCVTDEGLLSLPVNTRVRLELDGTDVVGASRLYDH